MQGRSFARGRDEIILCKVMFPASRETRSIRINQNQKASVHPRDYKELRYTRPASSFFSLFFYCILNLTGVFYEKGFVQNYF